MRVTHRNHLTNALAECKADADDDGKKGKQIMPYLARCGSQSEAPKKDYRKVLLSDLSPEADNTFVGSKSAIALFRSRPYVIRYGSNSSARYGCVQSQRQARAV